MIDLYRGRIDVNVNFHLKYNISSRRYIVTQTYMFPNLLRCKNVAYCFVCFLLEENW